MTFLVFLVSFGFFVQEDGYFVDGTTLTLKNGTVIQTTQVVKEDKYYYGWYEEGEYIAIDITKVKSVDYFSYYVPNAKKPELQIPSSVKRRLSGGTVAYGKTGQEAFRVVHVTKNGRSAAGLPVANRVKSLGLTGETEAGYRQMKLDLAASTDGTALELRFYSLKGVKVFTHRVEMDSVPQSRKERKKGTRVYQFQFPEAIPVNRIGLVEAVSYGP
ncbi:hypothetical protein [Acanthopleuribacter pedis]|uniref:Uncharacterized protein n=1 Tax=Acanthopleuribacter pedis TaxID=442870 RepID=A0A8J7QGW9_9BACT|nr:hypothetical protein [Acanthopleuribacter pedis]MBO1320126.1 hypothetical protein [Acanthopleuribacter pedis]